MKKWETITLFIILTAAAPKAQESSENVADDQTNLQIEDGTDDNVANFTHRQFYFGEDVPLPILGSDEDLPNISDAPSAPKRYYIVRIIKLNWYEAFVYCASKKMRLISPNTEELNDKLKKHLKKAQWGFGEYWTSLTDLAEKNVYQWMATGMPLTHHEWLPGEPNHKSGPTSCDQERCIALSYSKAIKNKRGWSDVPCYRKLNFICEK